MYSAAPGFKTKSWHYTAETTNQIKYGLKYVKMQYIHIIMLCITTVYSVFFLGLAQNNGEGDTRTKTL